MHWNKSTMYCPLYTNIMTPTWNYKNNATCSRIHVWLNSNEANKKNAHSNCMQLFCTKLVTNYKVDVNSCRLKFCLCYDLNFFIWEDKKQINQQDIFSLLIVIMWDEKLPIHHQNFIALLTTYPALHIAIILWIFPNNEFFMVKEKSYILIIILSFIKARFICAEYSV